VLVLAGLLTGQAAPPKTAPAKGDGKGTTRGAPPAVPAKPRLTIVATTSDVPEMAKVINDRLEADWAKNKVTPSRYVNDYEFIRRASLDVIGRVARPDEIKAYFKDPEDKRRSLLIERLLASEDYPRHWADMWSNWLLTRSGPFGRGRYKEEMAEWLKDQFAQNKPYAEIVEKLLTAKGTNSDSNNGAVNFVLAHVGEPVPRNDRARYGEFDMVPLTSRVTRLFLATQVQCAQCHDHPFHNNLKQNHFWGVNAFLRQVVRKTKADMRRQPLSGPLTLEDDPNANASGVVSFEKRNGVVLSTRAEFLPSGEDKDARGPRIDLGPKAPSRREQLAHFVIEHDNFPKAIVNRMWGVFFGRGFTNPVDDFNDNNQPSNPELLNELAAKFKHYQYDQKRLIRWICHSNAYQLSCVANATNDKPEHEVLFSRMVMKSLSPEQLFESLMTATNAEVLDNRKDKTKKRDEWLGRLIGSFGDDEGNEVNFNGTVVQALMMMNGEDINNAISRKDKGTVALAMARNRAPAGVVRDLYLAAVNRPPTPLEVDRIFSRMALGVQHRVWDARNPAAKYEDLLWALLNSNEFLLNH
jgi:hypothetical protein